MMAMIYLLVLWVEVIIAEDCSKSSNATCCTNYSFNEDSKSCDPCPPGTFDYNCSRTCPPGYYGRACQQKCNCDDGISCLPTTGCVSLTTAVIINADEEEFNVNNCSKLGKCCTNHFFNKYNNSCDPCPPGTFGRNCLSRCPSGYYGFLCNQRCDCDIGMVCIPTTGCVNITTTTAVGINRNEKELNVNNCSKSGKCCANHFFNKYNNSCDPCPPGTFGRNCLSRCPSGYYGFLCNQRCDCDIGMVCVPTIGCVNITTTKPGLMNTNEKEVNVKNCSKSGKCCANHFFNKYNNSCDPCPPGTFGRNCLSRCPSGYYGFLCNQRCDCDIGMVCTPTTGCVNITTTKPVVININEKELNVNNCSKSGKCCLHHFFNKYDNSCDPCPPGTFGRNCSSTCPLGYYGFLCNRKCDCDIAMVCIPTTGCINIVTKTPDSATNTIIVNTIPLHLIVVGFVISLLGVAASVFCCCRLWKFGIKQMSEIFRFKGNKHCHKKGANANAHNTLARQPSSQSIQETSIHRNPMQAAVETSNDIALSDFKRQTSDY